MIADPCLFVRLYSNALNREMYIYDEVSDADVTESIKLLMKTYQKKSLDWKVTKNVCSIDFNVPQHKIAYLHKYCVFHTKVVYDALRAVLLHRFQIRDRLQGRKPIKLCSLGGGPGTDVIAVMFALNSVYGSVKCCATVIDCYTGWSATFSSLIEELRSGLGYGDHGKDFKEEYFSCDYVFASLLKKMKPKVHSAVASADLLTMVKFISAVACTSAREMIEKVFNSMKDGSFVFFMDNATGGYQELVSEVADFCGLVSIYGPSTTVIRMDNEYIQNRFGYKSLQEAKVVVQVWRKEISNDSDSSSSEDDESPPTELDTLKTTSWVEFPPLKKYENISSVQNQNTQLIQLLQPELKNFCNVLSDCLKSEITPSKSENNSSKQNHKNSDLLSYPTALAYWRKSEITPSQNENSSEQNRNNHQLLTNPNVSACENKKHSNEQSDWRKSVIIPSQNDNGSGQNPNNSKLSNSFNALAQVIKKFKNEQSDWRKSEITPALNEDSSEQNRSNSEMLCDSSNDFAKANQKSSNELPDWRKSEITPPQNHMQNDLNKHLPSKCKEVNISKSAIFHINEINHNGNISHNLNSPTTNNFDTMLPDESNQLQSLTQLNSCDDDNNDTVKILSHTTEPELSQCDNSLLPTKVIHFIVFVLISLQVLYPLRMVIFLNWFLLYPYAEQVQLVGKEVKYLLMCFQIVFYLTRPFAMITFLNVILFFIQVQRDNSLVSKKVILMFILITLYMLYSSRMAVVLNILLLYPYMQQLPNSSLQLNEMVADTLTFLLIAVYVIQPFKSIVVFSISLLYLYLTLK